MTSRDEKLLQLWDVRKGKNDTDSSDDSKSNSSGELRKKKLNLFTSLVLPETEASDTPRDNVVHSRPVEATRKRKTKPCKKKSSVQSKSKKGSAKENKRSKINQTYQEVVSFEDLKTFSNSLIDELKVSRESMFAKMKGEMNKLVTSRRVKKSAALPRKGAKSGLKPQSFSEKNAKNVVLSETVIRSDRMLEKANETQNSERHRQPSKNIMAVSNNLDSVASSAFLTLPSAAPKPQIQNYQNGVGSGSKMDAKSYELPAFLREEHVGGLSGFLGRSCSQVEDIGMGFPVPLHQGLSNGGSKLPSRLCPETPLPNDGKLGQRLNQNEQFIGGGQVLSECIFPSSMNCNMHHTISRGGFALAGSPSLENRRI